MAAAQHSPSVLEATGLGGLFADKLVARRSIDVLLWIGLLLHGTSSMELSLPSSQKKVPDLFLALQKTE